MADRRRSMTDSYDPDVRALLRGVRDLVRADQEMRRRTSAAMRMNVTDVQALRFVIDAEREGRPATPRRLAEHLSISTASTTKLLDRLTASGHLARGPHPADRRSVVVTATDHAQAEVAERLGEMHARMQRIAEAVPAPARPAVLAFLASMSEELRRTEEVAPLTPAPGTAEAGPAAVAAGGGPLPAH